MRYINKQFEKVSNEFKKNENFIIENPDLPVSTMLETLAKQEKLEKLMGWLQNIENFMTEKNSKIVLPTRNDLTRIK